MTGRSTALLGRGALLGMALAALACAPSCASTTIGQAAPVGSALMCGDNELVVQDAVAAPPAYTIPPGGGVITQWRTTSLLGSNSQQMELKVLARASTTDYTVLAQDGPRPESQNQLNRYDVRIPVGGGDLIGLYEPAGTGAACDFNTSGGDTGRYKIGFPDPQVGSTITGTSAFSGQRVDVEATVEPDADRDGYGDETQDGCPADPTTHGQCQADLSVTQSADRATATVGDNVVYTVRVKNGSASVTAASVSLNEALPTGMALVSATANGGACTGTTCALGDISPLSSRSVTIVTRATAPGAAVSTVSATSTTPDPDGADNSSSAMTFVTAATPALFKGATVPNQSVTVSSKGHAAVSVGCPSGAGRCTGTLALLRHGSKFASSHFTIAAGSNAKVPVTIGRSIRRLLARTHKLVVTARTSSRDARGTATTRSVKITLKM